MKKVFLFLGDQLNLKALASFFANEDITILISNDCIPSAIEDMVENNNRSASKQFHVSEVKTYVNLGNEGQSTVSEVADVATTNIIIVVSDAQYPVISQVLTNAFGVGVPAKTGEYLQWSLAPVSASM